MAEHPEPLPATPAPGGGEHAIPGGSNGRGQPLRLFASTVARCLPWKRSHGKTGDSTLPTHPPASIHPWNGVGGTGLWSVQTLRTVLFLGCLAVTGVSAVALFHGLHQDQIAAIQDELPEVTELPPEQLQPSLAGALPPVPTGALPHPLTAPPAPPSIPAAPTLPAVITADARNAATAVAPAGDTTPPAPVLNPPAAPVPPQTAPAPVPVPAPEGGAGLRGDIEDDDSPTEILIRAAGTNAPNS